MAISITNAETERVLRLLADTTNETLTEAVRVSVVERLARLDRRSDSSLEELKAIVERGRERRRRTGPSDGTDPIEYDELGLPH